MRTTPNPVQSLHHFAYRCRNAEETRHFYEDILGMPLVHTVYHDHVPSTGEYHPYFHIFFRMQDGGCLAFFDLLDDTGYTPDPKTPAWVNHLAMNVASREDLSVAKARLEAHGIEVLGIVDHKIFDSIYFFDPNGIRLELAYQTAGAEKMAQLAADAHAGLALRDAKFAERRAKLAGEASL
ncbi:MAG: VOC family protein [Qipengyuania sp.]|nr:VOC family protein [Qipengyuania sp.]OYX52074.1 MAG: glyoxalase [Sphingomonas sp. 32-66-10]